MPDNNTGKKKVSDFTAEEKIAISARADKIELSRVAKEFGTSWQVVSAIQRAAKSAVAKAKSQAAKKLSAPQNSNAAKAPRSNDERRLAILKRASEIGVTAAAAEAGVSKWTVFQWRKIMKKAGYDIPRAARVVTKGPQAATAAQTLPTQFSMPGKKSGVYSQIELENEMLKQQVATLSEQLKKLRAALSQLA